MASHVRECKRHSRVQIVPFTALLCVCVCVCVCRTQFGKHLFGTIVVTIRVRFDQHVAHQTLHIIRRHHVHTMHRYRCALVRHHSIQYTVVKVKNLG